MVGQTISHYKVLEKIGEGGMGEVYLAEDQTLNRKVALKFLPDFMQQDPVAEKRFLREAKSAAALDHPFICNIYEAGVEDGKSFISMEFVRGENLKDKLEQGLLSLKDALEMATEIAEALETAHEANIVHRDLKPSNIMLTPDGHVKVMDFGLAKQLFPSRDTDAQEQSITASLTKTGMTLGTLAYMSPEQLRGDPVDTRSDIFSFGIVLYEMLTGTDPFQRPQPMETASAILKDDPPPLSRYLNEVPPFLERVMGKILAKGPDSRYQGVHDVGTDLRQLVREIAEPTQAGRDSFTGTTRERSEPRKSRQEMIAWGVAGLLAIALVSALITLWPNPPVEQSPVRFPFQLSADQFFGISNPSGAMLSPNGKRLAYVVVSGDNRQLYVRSLDQLEDTALPGTEGADTPFFSPDGQWLGFSADGKLKKISVSRGAVMTLCDVSGRKGASWGPDDTIIFARGGTHPLWRVPAAGGTPEQITSLDIEKGEDAHRHPWFLPDGKSVLFSAGVTNKFQEANIEVLSLETGERKVLHEGGYFARYLPTGHLVFMQESTLFSVPFDLERLELTGSPAPVLEGIWTNDGGDAQYTFSQNGILVYLPGGKSEGSPRSLVWVDREGKEQQLALEPRAYSEPRISPDGSRVALNVLNQGNWDVWVYDLARNTPTRLTFDPARDRAPCWTPDGKRVVFSSDRDSGRNSLFWRAADGTGPVERLTTSENIESSDSFSPTGKELTFTEVNPETGWDIGVLTMEGKRTSRPLIQTQFAEALSELSPDGRWIAYLSLEAGRRQLIVQPFPEVDTGKVSITGAGARTAVWGPDGRELFYEARQGGAMMVVRVETEPTFKPGAPEVLFMGRYFTPPLGRQYDIHPDGQRFLMIKETEETSSRQELILVLNWFDELKRLVPTDN